MPAHAAISEPLPDEDNLRAPGLITEARSPLELALQREFAQGRDLWRTVAQAIVEPRQGRKTGPFALDWHLLQTPGPDGAAAVEGTWALSWAAPPVGSKSRAPFDEQGSFRLEVGLDAEGLLRAETVSFRSELFEGLLPLVEIPAGEFLMGSPDSDREAYKDERPQRHEVIEAFSIGVTPVTLGQYAAVMKRSVGEAAVDHPVTGISWYDAIDFCNTLSHLAGRTPCYVHDDGWVEWRRGADGFRLPSEAEWEYACRAGTTTRYAFGDDRKRLGEFAWFAGNSNHRPQAVGQRRPNAWGLYDMHGNIWEWVWDRYGWYRKASSNGSSTDDSKRPPYLGNRVVRGGSFRDAAWALRSAVRLGHSPGLRDQIIGFRCAAPPRRPG